MIAQTYDQNPTQYIFSYLRYLTRLTNLNGAGDFSNLPQISNYLNDLGEFDYTALEADRYGGNPGPYIDWIVPFSGIIRPPAGNPNFILTSLVDLLFNSIGAAECNITVTELVNQITIDSIAKNNSYLLVGLGQGFVSQLGGANPGNNIASTRAPMNSGPFSYQFTSDSTALFRFGVNFSATCFLASSAVPTSAQASVRGALLRWGVTNDPIRRFKPSPWAP